MTYFIGLDEAGLGPNLGPLVVAASVWRLSTTAANAADSPASCPQALTRLAACADLNSHAPANLAGAKPTDLPQFADSKTLYHSGGSLAALELGVWAAQGQYADAPKDWRGIWELLAPTVARPWQDTVEAVDFDAPAFRAITPDRLLRSADQLRTALTGLDAKIVALRADVVFPHRFNRLLDECHSKGELLSGVALRLLRDIIEPLTGEPLVIRCDKHGGRNFYQPLLQRVFPDALVEVWRESSALSRYKWGPPNRRVEIEFAPRGERFVPTALASMIAKYLRERAMEPLNAFWQREVPGLKPTAGYPVDARRFWRETAVARERLQVADELLWRKR